MKATTAYGLKAIPRSIWALGLVSLLMDASSELVHSLLPAFLTVTLGASVFSLGLIEGVAEATASITKVFSGALSDYLGKRKFLTLLGYGLAALSKPLFPLASTIGMVFTARFIDRIGKGIRGAPRDALIGDLTPPHLRGAAFGLRQTMDTVGAFLGPLLALLFMALLSGNIRAVFWVALIPAALCLIVLMMAVHEPAAISGPKVARLPIHWAELKSLGRPYWFLIAFTLILMLARLSEAFFLLKAQSTGLRLALIPIILVIYNVVYAASAYPAGALSDRLPRKWVLAFGIAIFILADLALAYAASLPGVIVGVILWGLHMGVTSSLLSAMVADQAPPHLRGTAFGILNLAIGLGLLVASAGAGFLWDRFGPGLTFLVSAGVAAIALACLPALPSVKHPEGNPQH